MHKKAQAINHLGPCNGGEGGIRTHGALTRTPDFESGTFDHSATSPETVIIAALCAARGRSIRSVARVDKHLLMRPVELGSVLIGRRADVTSGRFFSLSGPVIGMVCCKQRMRTASYR